MVCVCAFSKWVEAWPARDLRSYTITRLFHFNITTRFGVCRVVRSDKGREFLGDFDVYLRGLGIDHRVISTAHPRANGLVERYNKCLKEGLRKMLIMAPQASWLEVLPEVLMGLRALPSRVGLSPYLICFK